MEFINLLFLLIPVLFWLGLCFIVSSVALKKGRDGTIYFFVAFFFSPLIGFLVLLIVGDSDELKLKNIKKEEKMRMNIRKDSGINTNLMPIEKKYESLEKLGCLLEKGFISKVEFDDEKKKIISDSFVCNKVETINDNTVKISNPLIDNLRYLIAKENNKKKLLGENNITDIINFLAGCCVTKNIGIKLIKEYNLKYNSNLINDLKALSTTSKETIQLLIVFIDLGIIEENYPHEMKEK